MPILHSVVSETDIHVVDPVIHQLAHKLVDDLNLTKYIKNNIYIDTGFSAVKTTKDDNHSAILNRNQLKIQAEINITPNNTKWEATNFSHALEPIGMSYRNLSRDYPCIFNDPVNNIQLYEMFLPTSITLNCTLSVLQRTLAYEIPSLLYRRYPPGMTYAREIFYDVPIPKDIFSMLFSLWKYKRFDKENKFIDYLNKYSNNFEFLIHRANNKKNELISKNIIINALVSTEYTDSKPEEVKINKMPVRYENKFTITVQFARPDMVVLKYPCVIDNTLLPDSLIGIPNKQESPMESIVGEYPQSSIDWYIRKTKSTYVDRTLVQFPYYDTWQVPGSSSILKKNYHPWFISLFLMDEDKEITELELGDILDEENGYEFHPILKEILKIQGSESFNNDVLFNLSVFNNGNEVDKNTLSIDENLTVSVPCKDLYKERRIVLSELTDIRKLNPKWYYLVRDYSGFLQLGLKDLEYALYGNMNSSSSSGNMYFNPNSPSWQYSDTYLKDSTGKVYYKNPNGINQVIGSGHNGNILGSDLNYILNPFDVDTNLFKAYGLLANLYNLTGSLNGGTINGTREAFRKLESCIITRK